MAGAGRPCSGPLASVEARARVVVVGDILTKASSTSARTHRGLQLLCPAGLAGCSFPGLVKHDAVAFAWAHVSFVAQNSPHFKGRIFLNFI